MHGGFSFIELIIYMSLLGVFLVIITVGIFSMARVLNRVTDDRDVARAGVFAIDRMARDIRSAESVDTGASTLGIHPGVLTLNLPNGDTRVFSITDTAVHVFENGVDQGPLTPIGVSVENLTFDRIVSPHSEAVRILATFEVVSRVGTTTRPFFSTVVLRGSYK